MEQRRLRPLVEADLDDALRIERQRAGRGWTREQLAGELQRSSWALEVNGTLTGFACLSLVPPEAELLTIVVDADARGRGHGSWLLDRVLDRAADAGCDDVWLEVRPSNAAARAMYRRHGFVEAGRRPGYYAAEGEDALLLRIARPGRGRV